MATVTPRVNTRSTRQALSEISRFVEGTSVVSADAQHVNINGILTPSPSPDELVIRARGRRKSPFHWSPKTYQCLFGVNQATTPVKGSPNKGSLPVRSSPRKKLQLNELKDTPSPSPTKNDWRRRTIPVSISVEKAEVSLETRLQAMSHEQLQNVICKITATHPQLTMEVEDLIPEPDLHPYEEKLKDIKKNIFGARPVSRLTSSTDSSAYQKVSRHLLAFKKCVIEQSKTLTHCEQWASLLEYCMIAWQHVRETPVWDNPPHNKPRQACFLTLTSCILQALKHATLNPDNVHQLINELQYFVADCKDFSAVIDFLEKKRNS